MIINLVMLVQVISALAIVGLVLVQHGKGADMGAAFGSGASGSLFGASGSSNFLSRSTGIAAAIFFASTLGLAYLNSGRPTSSSSALDAVVPATAPVAPAPAASTLVAPSASAPAASAPAASAVSAPVAAPAASEPAKSAPAASQNAPVQK